MKRIICLWLTFVVLILPTLVRPQVYTPGLIVDSHGKVLGQYVGGGGAGFSVVLLNVNGTLVRVDVFPAGFLDNTFGKTPLTGFFYLTDNCSGQPYVWLYNGLGVTDGQHPAALTSPGFVTQGVLYYGDIAESRNACINSYPDIGLYFTDGKGIEITCSNQDPRGAYNSCGDVSPGLVVGKVPVAPVKSISISSLGFVPPFSLR
jgi:hypothetical protein